MKWSFDDILARDRYSKWEIMQLLNCQGSHASRLFERAGEINRRVHGNCIYLRGLIEISNICQKNCFYCGIRKDNYRLKRYTMAVEEVVRTARRAMDNGFSSLVIQSGENQSPAFTRHISDILTQIRSVSEGRMQITLSCGEQTPETYAEWLEAGAHRYLLRIESSNKELFRYIHPDDRSHYQTTRLRALRSLKELGYQTGTGVLIGLPFQTLENLAEDLLFMKKFDIDMVAMGPYIPHKHTPLQRNRNALLPDLDRLFMVRKMVAVLRIMMQDINIAATTASEAISPHSREWLIVGGANVIMPNFTPPACLENDQLYRNKPDTSFDLPDYQEFTQNLSALGFELNPSEHGDPPHFKARNSTATSQNELSGIESTQ